MNLTAKNMAADFIARIMNVALTWAGIWPLIILLAPMIIGDENTEILKGNAVYIYYVSVGIMTILVASTMKPFLNTVMDYFVAMASPYGVINKDNTNVAVAYGGDSMKLAFFNTAFTFAKWQVIAFFALVTLNTELDKQKERSHMEMQKGQIKNLKIRVIQLEAMGKQRSLGE